MVFSIPFQRFPTSKVALMHPQGQSVDQKARHVLGPRTWDWFFWFRMRFHSLYYIFSKGSKIDPTCKPRMYRMFLSFQNLDGNIYSWTLYVWRFLNMWNPQAAHGARMGNCCWLWRLRMATISAWKVKGRFVERFWLNGFIEKWWIKYEKLWFYGFDHHKWWFQ